MRLGIDFGTTHTVVAMVDKRNYPVISFRHNDGETIGWFPSFISEKDGNWRYGMDALAVQGKEGWSSLGSFKRLLGGLSPEDTITLGDDTHSALQLLTEYLLSLKNALHERSSATIAKDEPLEVYISVPANANNKQRFLTVEAFQGAGFVVKGMINEPAAVGIAYAHQYGDKKCTGKQVIYDLGGGTFDVAIIGMGNRVHETLTNEGITRFGGDDFDTVLLDLALEQAADIPPMTQTQKALLLRECRTQKETLNDASQQLSIDLGSVLPNEGQVLVDVADYYRRCQPWIAHSIDVMEHAIANQRGRDHDGWDNISSIYVVGGAAQLAPVVDMLTARYGSKVFKSDYAYAATAVGLAISADEDSGYELQERFTRFFGVWRERDGGKNIAFDPIFTKGTLLPSPDEGELVYRRTYRPNHNVGHFRFLECGYLNEDHQPDGDVTPWQDVLFPFSPALENEDLSEVEVRRSKSAVKQVIEEVYMCDSRGLVKVTIKNKTSGYKKCFVLRQ